MTDLARALTLCGIQPGETFAVAAIRDREIRPACFSDVAAAEEFLVGLAGWNRYLTGNPVKPGCTGRPGASDVTTERVVLMDCDPAPDEAAARTACLRLAMYLQERVGQYPTIVDSGRGCQVWVRVGPLGTGARRRLARGLAARCALTGAKWDGTHDAARLMRCPGTENLKTGRRAQIIHEGTGPEITAADLDRLDLPPEAEVAPPPPVCADPPTPGDMALVTGRVKQVWDEPPERGDRSKRDFRLVLEALRAGADERGACRLLYAMPFSKAREDGRGDDYWRSTIQSVRAHMAREERLRSLALELPEAAKDDPGAPFEADALDALLLVRGESEPAWQRLRADLKKAKVPIRALEDAMAARIASQQDHEPVELRYVAADAKRVGWFRKTQDSDWVPVDASEAKSIMRARGLDPDVEIDASTRAPWVLVNEPFAEEVLPGRRWNKDGARLAFLPQPGPHPTWDQLLVHVGRGIDGAVAEDEWCRAGGVTTGGRYLMVWVGNMVQRPKARTAYLFLHGEQESGKSTLHEALRLLLTRGCVRANHALRSREGFNGEIANAILCVVEEVDLSDPRREAHERVKDWVTGDVISVRAMYRQAYDVCNCTHFIQGANRRSYMPVLPGDTRITEIHVERPDAPVAKEVFMGRLLAEAPAFLHTVTTMKLPEPLGRLAVPALQTCGKREQADASGTDLDDWLARSEWLELSDQELVGAFLDWLPGAAKIHWDRQRVMRELPATARRDRRLAAALRELPTGQNMVTTRILESLPKPVRTEWTLIGLGRALARLSETAKWIVQERKDGTTLTRFSGR